MLSRFVRQFHFAAVGLVLLTVATRLPALVHPRAIDDEAVYSVVANEIVDGGRPYVDAVERKPPLLFWTYAAVFRLAGKYNWYALHAVALAWTLFTMAGLYVIGRTLFDHKVAIIAALLYSIFQPWGDFRNLAFNGELLMNLPIVWAWAIAFGRSSSRLRPELFVAGALLCAAFLLKQPGAIAAVPLGIYLLLPIYRTSRGLTRAVCLTQAAILTAGFCGLLGLVVIALRRQGILGDALYWTISANRIPHVFWQNGILATLAFAAACLPLMIGAARAIQDNQNIWCDKNAERAALFGLLIASAVGTAAGARFNLHYYIQLVPPLTLLAAPHLMPTFSQRIPRWFQRVGTRVWLALTITVFSITHWCELLPRRIPTEAGRYLATHAAPDDRIFIWGGSAAQYYLDARRRPACRYVLTFPLTGFIFGGPVSGVDGYKWIAPGAWANLQEDFVKHPPVYIADLYATPGAQFPIGDFPVLSRLLAENYQPVAKVSQGVIYQMR
jgi:4-amino-4-deoxy-L-arabinose transferase-like glycosyltransferase